MAISSFEYIETGFMILVFAIVSIGVLALMQQYFTKELFKPKETHGAVDASAAANAKLLLKIDAPSSYRRTSYFISDNYGIFCICQYHAFCTGNTI